MTAPEVTIWEKLTHANGRNVSYYPPALAKRRPDGKYEPFTIEDAGKHGWPETELGMDVKRRRKHLTDAELMAEMWRAVYEDEVFEYADPEHKYSQALHRFATHDQAV